MGQGHVFVSGPEFTKLFSSNAGKIVVDNAVFRLSIAWSVLARAGLLSKNLPRRIASVYAVRCSALVIKAGNLCQRSLLYRVYYID